MPVYEYRCNHCQKRTSVFVRSIGAAVEPACPACGSKDLSKLVSSFAYHKSAHARLEESGSPDNPSPDYYKDPRNIGRWAEKRLDELGIDMNSEEYKNTFSEVREHIAAARDGDMSILNKEGL